MFVVFRSFNPGIMSTCLQNLVAMFWRPLTAQRWFWADSECIQFCKKQKWIKEAWGGVIQGMKSEHNKTHYSPATWRKASQNRKIKRNRRGLTFNREYRKSNSLDCRLAQPNPQEIGVAQGVTHTWQNITPEVNKQEALKPPCTFPIHKGRP